MATADFADLLTYLHKVCSIKHALSLSDSELLERFILHREDSAFSALVKRHGPMVLATCKRILGDAHLAEDAFQATFVILARRAATVRKKELLAGWLYRVAQRIARKARLTQNGVQSGPTGDTQAIEMPDMEPIDQLTLKELRSVMDEEIVNLPDKYRDPILLCYFEGKSHVKAAEELGWPKTSLTSRLARGRELLRQQLIRRGITLSAGVLTTALTASTSKTAVGAMLTIATVKAACSLVDGSTLAAAGLSARAITLAEAAMKGMFWTKTKSFLFVVAMGVALGGTGLAGNWTPRTQVSDAKKSGRDQAITAKIQPAKEKPAPVDHFGDLLPPGALKRLGSARFRHSGYIFDVAYSPDGKMIASASGDGENMVRLWDAATGRELNHLKSAKGPTGESGLGQVFTLAFSPDSKTLAFAGHGDFVNLWDVSTGTNAHQFNHSGAFRILASAFSPDGKTLATGGFKTVMLWDITTGTSRGFSVGQAVKSLAFAPDGKSLVVASGETIVQLWDPTTCIEILKLPQFPAQVDCVAFASNGKIFATGCKNGMVEVWDAVTGIKLQTLQEAIKLPMILFHTVAISPDGKTLIAGNTGSIWDIESGKEKGRLDDLVCWMHGLAISPDGKTVARAESNVLRLFDAATGKATFQDDSKCLGAQQSIAYFPDSRTIASGAGDATVRLWETATGKPIRTLRGSFDSEQFRTSHVAVSPDGELVAAWMTHNLYLWDAKSGKELWTVKRIGPYPCSLAFSPDNSTLATGSDSKDKMIRLRDVNTGKELRSFGEVEETTNCLAYSSDGRTLASANMEGTISLWDVTTGKKSRTFTVPSPAGDELKGKHAARSIAFSPRGGLLASGNFDKTVCLWDTATGKLLFEFNSINSDVSSVAFSPDGKTLAAVGRHGVVELWEVTTGKLRRTWIAHPQNCSSVAFAPDGRSLATSGYDTTVLIWDPFAPTIGLMPSKAVQDLIGK